MITLFFSAMTWYVVHNGRQTGVFSSWKECHAQVIGYKGACYQGYKSRDDAFHAFYGHENKLAVAMPDNSPKMLRSSFMLSSSWKDVLILAQSVVIVLLVWYILYA